MAGINRLGKGPAKPGTMRPADPNKYKTTDIFSEGTEGDKEYQRMVQDIEDTQQNHTGWLFGRGAFDKGDLLYLRDEEEKRRYAEQELRESEMRNFNKMRQKVMSLEDKNFMEPQSTSLQQGRDAAGRNQIRVTAKPKVKLKRDPDPSVREDVKVEKKIKLEPVKKEEENGQAPGPITSTKIKEEKRQEFNDKETVNEEPDADDAGDGAGLGGLLGDYDSDSEEEKKPELPLPDFFKTKPP